MSKFPAGTRMRLISNPVEGARDIGEVFIAAEYPGGKNAPDGLQCYLGRDGKVTYCPADYFESASPIQTVVIRNTKLVSGHYGRVHIEPVNPNLAAVRFLKRSGEPIGSNAAHLSAREWRELSDLAAEIADFLE